MSKIYVLQHKDENFSDVFHGVQFQNGRGTTSSYHDAEWCITKSKKNPNPPIQLIKSYTPWFPEEIKKAELAEKEKTAKAKMAKAREAKKSNAKKKTGKTEEKEEEKSEVESQWK